MKLKKHSEVDRDSEILTPRVPKKYVKFLVYYRGDTSPVDYAEFVKGEK